MDITSLRQRALLFFFLLSLLSFTLPLAGQANFTISASPVSLSIMQGTRRISTITTTVSGGFNSAITLSSSGAPSGTMVTFAPFVIAAPGAGTATVYVSVGSNTPVGTYPITVAGNGGGIRQTTTVTLTVTAQDQANFTISASPASLSVTQGNQGNSTITTTISGGFNSDISLSATGIPSGTSVSFNPQTIPAPGAGNSTMTITVGSATPVGTYPITVTGDGGGIQQNTTVTLTVTAAGNWQQGFDFRNTSTFVTDPTGDTYVLSSTAYPTKGNGVTYGWLKKSLVQARNRNAKLDPRLAGINFATNGSPATFYVDLPSAGTYNLSLAMGDAGYQACWVQCQIQFLDGGTVLATVTKGSTKLGYFYDAKGNNWSAAAWPGSNVSQQVTLAGTRLTVIVGTSQASGDSTPIAFLGIAQVSGSPNFAISASPSSLTVAQGNQGTSTIATTISGGFNSSITLSASGVPSGTTVSFNPKTIPAPGAGSSTMTITVGASTAVGTYPIKVTGNGGGIKQTTTVTLTVTAQQQPNFTLSASPASLTIPQGNGGASTITATISGGFNSSIALSASGMPSGTTVGFNPNPIPAPGSGNSTMTITVGGSTPTGTYPITVTGNGGGIQQNTTVMLTVITQQQAQQNFTVSVSPVAVSLPQGNQGTATVTTAITGGFNSSIDLSASGVPDGTTISFNPSTIGAPGAGTSVMTITVGSGTLSGAYPISVNGNGGGLQRSATFLLTVTTSDSAGAPFPTPPQVYVDTTWNPPTSGTTWNVGCTGNLATDAANLQNAINSSVPGDVIVAAAGCTYSGNFVLPPKSNPNNQWIYIESSALANLPPPGTRVGPSDGQNMPTITTPNTGAAIIAECSGSGSCTTNGTPYGANHFRLVGLQLTSTSTYGCQPSNNPPIACWSYYIVQAQSPDDGSDGSTSHLSDSITVDRCYIHGLTNGANSQDVSHGIGANATNLAVIDSYISDIHITGTEAQGILGYYTPGPIKIVNNYISSTTQEIMFGGAGGLTNPYVPSDIELRRNVLFKPTSWDSCGTGGTVPPGSLLPSGAACPSGSGAAQNQWIEKNNLEFKSARRAVVTGNVIENSWVAGQTGSSVLFTVRTSGSGNGAVVDDILFQSNILANVDAGISTLEEDDNCLKTPGCVNLGETKRIWVDNNLFLVSPNLDTYEHTALWLDGGDSTLGLIGLTDFVFQHNTVLMSDLSTIFSSLYFEGSNSGCPPPSSTTHNVWILDNALSRQPRGDCGYTGTVGLGYYMSDPAPLAPRFYGNVMFVPSGDGVQQWPGTSNDATTTPFTYADPGNGDYQLLIPDWLTTTDGNVSGIDWSALQQAMNP